METLIELYDEVPLENVLGVEMFRPSRVVYICPEGAASDAHMQKKLRAYFAHRGLKPEILFLRSSVYDVEAMLRVLKKAADRWPDCAIDITGGTDAVLFAVGLLCSERDIPVFTYSRRKNTFFSIKNAHFADNKRCGITYSVEDAFLMAGGTVRQGRVDNSVLENYMGDVDAFFDLYLKYRRDWTRIIGFFQRVSPTVEGAEQELGVTAGYTVKGERGSRIDAHPEALGELEAIGFIDSLSVVPGESVSFRFRDAQKRVWLRDVGSVLELKIYKACVDSGLFDDVKTSTVVDWDSEFRSNVVTNELDVMCTRGVMPVFISCKTCEVKTEALNELAILRDRFGGKTARAAIVTTKRGGASMRNRAFELGIQVIDLDDLLKGRLESKIASLAVPGK